MSNEYKHKDCDGRVLKVTIPQVDDEDRYFCIKCAEWVDGFLMPEKFLKLEERR